MDDDEEIEARQEAMALMRRMGRASTKLADSPVERKLRLKLGANGVAGAYLIRSFELMIEQGRDLTDTANEHQKMVDIIRQWLLSVLEGKDGSGAGGSFLPGSPFNKH